MFFIQNITGTVSFVGVDFVDNIIHGHVIEAILLQNLIINNTNCTNGDSINKYPNIHWNNIGGCFRTINILNRHFENIKIINSFSDKTSFGIKIIDEINQLKSIQNFNIINMNVRE